MDVPSDGAQHRTFDYSSSRLGGLGSYMVLFSVLWLSVVGLIGYFNFDPTDPGKASTATLEILLPLLGLFGLVGVAVMVAGLAYIFAWKNESITLDGDKVTWTGRNGQVASRFTLDQVRSVDEKTFSQPRPGYIQYSPLHHKCVVKTTQGTLIFSDEISDYEWLEAFLLKREVVAPTGGTFRYRSPSIFLVAAVATPLTGFAAYVFTSSYLHGQTMPSDAVTDVTPIWAPVAVIGVSSILWVTIIGFVLQYLNERIVVTGDHLSYFNMFGTKKVDVPLGWVEKGSFQKIDSALKAGSSTFSVETPQGSVRWADTITRCTDLRQILSVAAGGQSDQNG